MAEASLNAVTYFAPIAAFLIVFVVVYAVLIKSKLLGENKWANLFISFLIAALFVSAVGAVSYVRTIVPWFAVLLLSVVFLLLLTGIIGEPVNFLNKGIGIGFVVILAIVFLVSGFVTFSGLIEGFLPGPGFGKGLSEGEFFLFDRLYSPRISGAILLIIISAAVSWVLVRTGKSK